MSTARKNEDRAFISWFVFICFGYQYKAILCGLLGKVIGCEALCYTVINGVDTNHWFETIFYAPLLWLALHRVNGIIFINHAADKPRSQRNRLIGEIFAAVCFYGMGIHVANLLEIYSREIQGISSGPVYEMIYFFDEVVSHFVQFIPYFLLLGWYILHDQPNRRSYLKAALWIGAGHGIERTVGIIEGNSWYFALPVVIWYLACLAIRVRQLRAAGFSHFDFFALYAAGFLITMPTALVAYALVFDGFVQPSALGSRQPWLLPFVLGLGGALTLIIVLVSRAVPSQAVIGAAEK